MSVLSFDLVLTFKFKMAAAVGHLKNVSFSTVDQHACKLNSTCVIMLFNTNDTFVLYFQVYMHRALRFQGVKISRINVTSETFELNGFYNSHG